MLEIVSACGEGGLVSFKKVRISSKTRTLENDTMFLSLKRKIIFLCVAFNLVMEFWVWGLAGFLNPVLLISLFLIYLSFFSILADLLVRFNLRDHHIILFGFFFGMFQEIFNKGSVFDDPNFFGVNLINIALINIVWWGVLQGVFTLYFANRLVEFKKEEAKKMGKISWGLAVGFILFMFLVNLLEKTLPSAPLSAYAITVSLMFASFLFFLLSDKNKPARVVEKIKLIDILIIIQIILSILIGFLQLVFGYVTAVYLFMAWSVFMALIYVGLKFKRKVLVG